MGPNRDAHRGVGLYDAKDFGKVENFVKGLYKIKWKDKRKGRVAVPGLSDEVSYITRGGLNGSPSSSAENSARAA